MNKLDPYEQCLVRLFSKKHVIGAICLFGACGLTLCSITLQESKLISVLFFPLTLTPCLLIPGTHCIFHFIRYRKCRQHGIAYSSGPNNYIILLRKRLFKPPTIKTIILYPEGRSDICVTMYNIHQTNAILMRPETTVADGCTVFCKGVSPEDDIFVDGLLANNPIDTSNLYTWLYNVY